MSTQFHGMAEDIQHKLTAGEGIEISPDFIISAPPPIKVLPNVSDLKITDPGIYFVPYDVANNDKPNGSRDASLLIVANGDVGGGEGVRQYALIGSVVYSRSRYSTGVWSIWVGSNVTLERLLDGEFFRGLGLTSNDFTDEDKAAVGLIPELSNALVGKAAGSPVEISDVSPIAHKVKAQVFEKNLFDREAFASAIDAAEDAGEEIVEFPITLEPGFNYTWSTNALADVTLTLYGVTLVRGQETTYEITSDIGSTEKIVVFETSSSDISYYLDCTVEGGRRILEQASEIQIEKGETVTAYAPYGEPGTVTCTVGGKSQTIIPDADGVVHFNSASPEMKIESSYELPIEVEYHRDINKLTFDTPGTSVEVDETLKIKGAAADANATGAAIEALSALVNDFSPLYISLNTDTGWSYYTSPYVSWEEIQNAYNAGRPIYAKGRFATCTGDVTINNVNIHYDGTELLPLTLMNDDGSGCVFSKVCGNKILTLYMNSNIINDSYTPCAYPEVCTVG